MSDTFLDARGVTHEALDLAYRGGEISFCGQLREPWSGVGKETAQLRAFARREPPKGVDCMTCLIRRVRVDRLAHDGIPGYRGPRFELLIRITSWG